MTDTPTPGQVGYTAYYHTWLRQRHRSVRLTWTELAAEDRHAWEAAAQAAITAWIASPDWPTPATKAQEEQ